MGFRGFRDLPHVAGLTIEPWLRPSSCPCLGKRAAKEAVSRVPAWANVQRKKLSPMSPAWANVQRKKLSPVSPAHMPFSSSLSAPRAGPKLNHSPPVRTYLFVPHSGANDWRSLHPPIGHEDFGPPPINRWGLYALPLTLGRCCDTQSMAEVILCHFPGPGLKKLAASTSCLLKCSLWVTWAIAYKSGHLDVNCAVESSCLRSAWA